MPVISPSSVDILVNTDTANLQLDSRITALAGGRYLVTWTGPVADFGPITNATFNTADIRGQIFNANGTPFGGEFVINTTILGTQTLAEAVELSDGNILVTWQDGLGTILGGASGPPAVVRAQEFTSTGNMVGSEFQIAGGAGASAEFHAISALADGGYVVVWQAGGNGALLAQVFDSNNAKIGNQITIGDNSINFSAAPSVATLTNGNFVVAWTNAASSFLGYRIYTAAGTAITDEISGGTGAFAGRVGNVVALTTGGFAIGLRDSEQWGLAAFASNGEFLSDPVIARSPGNQPPPTLVALANGGLVAYWQQFNTLTQGIDVLARGYGNSGEPFGTVFTVNSNTLGFQGDATGAALLSDGNIVFSWTDSSGSLDTSGTGIVHRRFAVDYTNTAPIANNDVLFVLGDPNATIDFSDLVGNDSDPDSDALMIVSVANGINGAATIDLANDTITFAQDAGATGPLSFTYTVADTSLAISTATVDLGILRSDVFSVRGNFQFTLDFLANDVFPAGASGISITGFLNGSSVPLTLVDGRQQLLFSPVRQGTDYFNLQVGQSDVFNFDYVVAVNGIIQQVVRSTITREGWAQLGGASDDNLTGSLQPDHLSGGAGVNVLTGLAGNDHYTVTNATTSVVEATGSGFDTVRTTLSIYTLPNNVESLVALAQLFFVTRWDGNELNNFISVAGSRGGGIVRGLGGNDNLQGSLGNDTFEGGDGDDILNGGAGTDTVSYANSLFGVTVHLDDTARQNTVQQGFDTITGFENILGSSSHDMLFGNNANNDIRGGAGFDTIMGGGGTNTLIGGADGDTYFVQGFNDIVVEDVGGGYDVVLSQVNFTLVTLSEVEALAVNTTSGIALTGNEFQQTLTGNVGDDILSGGGGNDLIISGAGTNTLIGGTGADIYFAQGLNDVVTEDAGGGFDVVLAGGNLTLAAGSEVEVIAVNTTNGVTIIGSDTNQTIQGAGGNDRFVGGLGNDTLTGSGGADTFVLFNTFADRDFVTDFVSGTDKLEISAALFGGGLSAGVLSGAQFFSGAGAVSATSAAQRFIYNSSTGNLLFDADGNGAGAAVLFANLSSIPTLTAADFLIAA
jgi:Ca2+-binding RTX toxin-like protein